MVSRFHFDTVSQLVESGVTNYVQIRQQAGLTSDELDEILKNYEYLKRQFAEQDKLEAARAEAERNKSFWNKIKKSLNR